MPIESYLKTCLNRICKCYIIIQEFLYKVYKNDKTFRNFKNGRKQTFI